MHSFQSDSHYQYIGTCYTKQNHILFFWKIYFVSLITQLTTLNLANLSKKAYTLPTVSSVSASRIQPAIVFLENCRAIFLPT